MAFVYILYSLCNDTYYVGSTNDLSRRIKEHLQGKSTYTKLLLPLKLVFSQQFENMSLAHKAELWIKKQKSRKFIERLIKEGILKKKFD